MRCREAVLNKSGKNAKCLVAFAGRNEKTNTNRAILGTLSRIWMGLPGIYSSASHPPKSASHAGTHSRARRTGIHTPSNAAATVTVRRRPAGCPSGRTPSLSCRVPQPPLVCSLPPPPLLSRSRGERSWDPSGRGLFLLVLVTYPSFFGWMVFRVRFEPGPLIYCYLKQLQPNLCPFGDTPCFWSSDPRQVSDAQCCLSLHYPCCLRWLVGRAPKSWRIVWLEPLWRMFLLKRSTDSPGNKSGT
jgi:hypothetical protein